MLRTSPSKKVTPINVFNIQQMTYIKYLDVYRDQKLSWKNHMLKPRPRYLKILGSYINFDTT